MEKEYTMPNDLILKNEYLKNYGNEFLKLNNLKIGDEVEMNFSYEGISQGYKTREMSKYTYKQKAKGILKIDENGLLFAESLDNFPFYEYKNNNLSGRSRRNYYQEYKKKSIIKFGVGFIF